MKKLLVFLTLSLLIFAACGGNKEGSDSFKGVEAITNGTVIESENFSITVPEEMVESLNMMQTINATADNGFVRFAATYNTGGPTVSQLKTYAENLVAMVKALDSEANIGKPEVNGKLATLRSVTEGNVRIDFTYLKDDTAGLAGSFKFPEDQAEKWEKQLLPILKSVVFK